MSNISIDPATYVITIPQSYLAHVSGPLYELDVEQFRLDLIDWEDSEDGVWMPRTHSHATAVVLSGVTYARSVEIAYPYTVTFEDGQYVVRCVGANHNLADVKNANSVSLIVGNAAGLIKVTSGSGLSEEQSEMLADIDEVTQGNFEELSAMATQLGEVQDQVQFIDNVNAGRWLITEDYQMVFYAADNETEVCRFDLFDAEGQPAIENVFERRRA